MSDLKKADTPGNPVAPATLDTLRQEIDAIDESIVDLLARRHSKVQQVVALKTAQGLPVYHPAREENLISQRREQALRAGIDPGHVEELYRSIIRQSRVRQTDTVAKRGVKAGYKVLIVGGRGRMGQYFGRWFGEAGYEVRVLDIHDWPQVKQLTEGIHLALVCVPIDVTVPVIQQLGPHLPAGCVFADITSLKSGPLAAMLAAHRGPVVGLHPLFGPSTTSMDKQIVAAIPGRNAESCRWVLEQFTAWGNIVEVINARDHDDVMNLVQGLRHFATFAFGRFLYQQNLNVSRTLELSSPIYRLELGMVGRLFAQDPELYAHIIAASPERRELLKQYVASVSTACETIQRGEVHKFCEEFAATARWFGPFCEQAMRESSFLIDKLVERF